MESTLATLPGCPTKGATSDPTGRLWVGSGAGDLVVFDGNTWESKGPAHGGFQYVGSMDATPEGDLWVVANHDQLWRYNEQEWFRYDGSITTRIAGKRAAMLGDLHGMECYRGGLIRADGNGVLNGVPLIGGEILDILADSQGNVWIASNGPRTALVFDGAMLHCWNDMAFSNVGYNLGLAAQEDGAVWIQIGGIGVFKYDGSVWSEITDVPPILGIIGGESSLYLFAERIWQVVSGSFEPVYQTSTIPGSVGAVLPTADGGFWALEWRYHGLKTGNAVVRYSPSGDTERFPYPNEREVTLDAQAKLAQTPDGRLWLGDRDGLFVLRPAETWVAGQSWAKVKAEMTSQKR